MMKLTGLPERAAHGHGSSVGNKIDGTTSRKYILELLPDFGKLASRSKSLYMHERGEQPHGLKSMPYDRHYCMADEKRGKTGG